MMVMTKDGIYAASDRLGRTPVEIGTKEDSKCICFESFSYLNLGYHHEKELGPGEICYVTPESVGIHSENIRKFIERLEEKHLATHSLILAKGNQIFFENYWEPFNKEFLHRMYSVSKSFVAISVGFLEQD